MLSRLRNLLTAAPAPPVAKIPDGQRVYAIGDIHGRADLLAGMIAAIDADDLARGSAQTTVILLGDLIDRGPDSAGVIRLAREWQKRRPVRILMGNHEEMFLDALEQEEVMRHFLRFGGREMLLSYPLDPLAYTRAELGEVADLARAVIPEQDITFIRSFEDQVELGDYLFVHAGIRPGVALADQRRADLRDRAGGVAGTTAVASGKLVRLTLGQYRGSEAGLVLRRGLRQLHDRHQHRCEHAENRKRDEQLDQREAPLIAHRGRRNEAGGIQGASLQLPGMR